MAQGGRRIAGLPSRIFGPGEVIFRQGDPGSREAYLVHEGRVEIRRGIAGGERILRTLGRGDLLGEVALFSDAPHSATALALERVILLVVPAGRLEEVVRTKPDLAIAIIRQLARMAATEDARAGLLTRPRPPFPAGTGDHEGSPSDRTAAILQEGGPSPCRHSSDS